jgi:hypothetical protein
MCLSVPVSSAWTQLIRQEIGLTTPKADMNEDDCQLSRQQSDCSAAEAGMGVAMHALRSDYVVKVKRNGQSFEY